MKVAVITKPYEVQIQEMECPKAKSDEVLIRVVTAGICGSDLHLFKGTHAFRKLPAVLGHEVAGEIIETGSAVTRFKAGDRVTVEPQVGCGSCEQCMAGRINLCAKKAVPGTPNWIGTFADYFIAPEKTVYRLNETVSYELGTLIEPLAVAVHAVRVVNEAKDSTLVILGCGTIGLLSLVVAREHGISRIICTDTAPYNRKMAMEMGAAASYDPITDDVTAAVLAATNGRGADAVIIAAGAANIVDQASAVARKCGKIVLVSMMTKPVSVYTYSLVFKEQTLVGTMTYTTDDFAAACEMINRGLDLCKMITHELPMSDSQKGLTMLDQKLENVVKILVHP